MNIAALISGGVDSAVVVHLLCKQGYKPDLFYIKIGMDGDEDLTCTAEEDIELCTATARKYGLNLNIIDLHRQYWDNVVAYAIDKVKHGLTPNPDVMCNKLIKFGCFEQEVGHLYDKTATGHYASILEKDGKIFCAQRPEGKSLGGFWEFPGGKLEIGESPEQALIREIKEELNSEIEIVSYINEASYDYDFGTVVMKTYHAKLLSGNLELLEHQNSTWLAPNELTTLNWAPVDRPAVELLTNK